MFERRLALTVLLIAGTLIFVSLVLPGGRFLLEWHRTTDDSFIWKSLFRWQTVYQAWIEVLIAIAGSAGVLWQIWSEKEKEEKQRKRQLNSLRISLVSFLSDASQFLERDAQFYYTIYNRMNFYKHPPPFDGHFHAGDFNGDIKFDRSIFDNLRDFANCAEDASLRAVEIFIRQLQVYEVRSKKIKSNNRDEFSYLDLINIMIDNASLYQRIEYLFPYARKDKDAPQYIITSDDLKVRIIHLYPKAETDTEMQRLIEYEAEKSVKLAMIIAA